MKNLDQYLLPYVSLYAKQKYAKEYRKLQWD